MQLPPGTRFDVAALLFDMDGTLIDSTPVIERRWRDWATRCGFDGDAVIHFCHGRPSVLTVRQFRGPEPSDDEIRAEAAAVEASMYEDGTGVRAIPGAAALLAALPPERWAVVTSASHAGALVRFEQAGLPRPGVLIGVDDVTRGKPDPEGYRGAAQRLGVDPAACLVLEDAPAGILAGRAAGARILALATTFPEVELDAEDWLHDLTPLRVTATATGLSVEVVPV